MVVTVARRKSLKKSSTRAGCYLLAVKDNQGSLAQALRAFFADGEDVRLRHTADPYLADDWERPWLIIGQALWVTDLFWMDKTLCAHWTKLAGVGMIIQRREAQGKISTERAFYIGSLGITTALFFAKATRRHCGIKNRLH